MLNRCRQQASPIYSWSRPDDRHKTGIQRGEDMTEAQRKQAAHGHADNIEAAIRSADADRFKTAVIEWLGDVATPAYRKDLTSAWKSNGKDTLEGNV